MKTNSLSLYVQNYFMSFLIAQKGYGDNTISSYRDTFRLLFRFLEGEGKKVAKLKLADLDKMCILIFLQWLEDERKNTISTRNVRLAHFKSFFGYVLSLSPEVAAHCGNIINIPFKKMEQKPPIYLTESETKTLLNMPDSNTRAGLRHMTILTLCSYTAYLYRSL